MLKNIERKYDYSDVHIVPNDSDIISRQQVNLDREFTFKWSSQKKYGVGIIAANMDTVGTIPMAEALREEGVFTALHKHHSPAEILNLFKSKHVRDLTFYTMGIWPEELKQLEIMRANDQAPDMICIDIANGHANILLDAIERVRALMPDAVIMAGNVVTASRAVAAIEAGADIVKVGIGSGSACTTRKQTGVGYPQLSAVYECAKAVDAIGGLVCADGGCTVPGDIAKAYIAGADFVMLGCMLAGTNETGGRVMLHEKVLKKSVRAAQSDGVDCYMFHGGIYFDLGELPEKAWKYVPRAEPKMLFYGMSSSTAMDKYHGGVAHYRSSEGRTLLIPYKGSVRDVISDILGGLRSSLSYVGVIEVSMAAHSAKFVETANQLNTVFLK